MRCPHCGNESDLEEYICSNCQYRLKFEDIEKIPFFRRPEGVTWYKAENFFKRIVKVIVKPSIAFFNINHKKKDAGPLMIKLLNGLIIGLMALVVAVHTQINLYQGYALTTSTYWVAIVQDLPVFLVFSVFGFLFYSVIFWFYNFMFSIGANFSVQLDDILSIRYNVQVKKNTLMDILSGKMLRKKVIEKTQQITAESLKSKEFLTKISQTGKYSMMGYAYAPILIINLISVVILLVALPSITINNTLDYPYDGGYSTLTQDMAVIFESPAWAIVDFLQIVAIAVWVPVTMSIAMREIGNTNTTKLLIGNVIIGILCAYMLFFIRPTLGWNFGLIGQYLT
jgi:hypothetical protein